MLLLNCFSIVNINGNKKSFPLNFRACTQKQFLRQRKRNCWFKFSFIYSLNVPRNKKYLKMKKKLCLNLKILKFRRFIVVNKNYELTNLWALFNQIMDLKHSKWLSFLTVFPEMCLIPLVLTLKPSFPVFPNLDQTSKLEMFGYHTEVLLHEFCYTFMIKFGRIKM